MPTNDVSKPIHKRVVNLVLLGMSEPVMRESCLDDISSKDQNICNR